MPVTLGSGGIPLVTINAAPGNLVTIPGTDLGPGVGASVTLNNQGVVDPPGYPATTTLTLPALFEGTQVVLGPLPDGINSGTLTVTGADATTATCGLRVFAQYVQASEYAGEGMNIQNLTGPQLDVVLRRASAIVDAYMGKSLRLLQIMEQPKYRDPRQEMAPRLYPWRISGRDCPLISCDQLNFVSAKNLVTTFNDNDLYVNTDLKYIEVLAYAIGNYALLGALETIGYSANVYHLTYTSGFGVSAGSYTNVNGTFNYPAYPQNVWEATTIVATRLLQRSNIAAMNMGQLKSFEDKAVFVTDFVMPQEARMLLRPYIARRFA